MTYTRTSSYITFVHVDILYLKLKVTYFTTSFIYNTQVNMFYIKHPLTRTYSTSHDLIKDHEDNLNSKSSQNNPFFSVIPTKYIQSKDLPIFLHLFALNSPIEFRYTIINNIPCGAIYTVFIKVRYDQDNFFMAGNQFGFNYKSFNDRDDLLSIIKKRLKDLFEEYKLTDDSIVYIQLNFRKLDTKLLSEFKLDNSNNISLSESSSIKRKLNIPVSVNEN